MNKYITPELNIVVLEEKDIITESVPSIDGDLDLFDQGQTEDIFGS